MKAKKTGEAQEALEMAETRALDRSTPADSAGTPDSSPLVADIQAALGSLQKKDWKGTSAAIDKALADPGAMDKAAPSPADKPTDKPAHHKPHPKKPAAPAPDAAPPAK